MRGCSFSKREPMSALCVARHREVQSKFLSERCANISRAKDPLASRRERNGGRSQNGISNIVAALNATINYGRKKRKAAVRMKLI